MKVFRCTRLKKRCKYLGMKMSNYLENNFIHIKNICVVYTLY